MENNNNRRILFAIGVVLFFAIIVIVWYFVYAKPVTTKSITETNNPFPVTKNLPRFQFITWGQDDTSTTTTEITDPFAVPLVKVWDKPATGQTFITQDVLREVTTTATEGTTTIESKKMIRSTSTVLIFVDRTTGYIYGFPVETGKVFQISNTILPGIYDAYFFNKGKQVLMRYIDQEKNTIVGIIATLPSVKENEMALPLLNTQYLTSQVTSVATNLKKSAISYIAETETGSAVYTITSKGPTFVTASPFKEWTLSYGGDSLYVTTKPSAYVDGSTFSAPSFQSEVIDKTGLMSNPGSSGFILNSMWTNQGLATFISNKGNNLVLSFTTLASKCGWDEKNLLICAIPKITPTGEEGLPDDWFQGRVSFDDELFTVDPKTGYKYTLYSFTQENGVFDVTNITPSLDSQFMSFTKKQDASLWMLNLTLLGGD